MRNSCRHYLENIQKLVEAVCKKDSGISGDADDYHNLSSELARNNQLDLSLDVLNKGREVFMHNTDILAGIVLYSTRIGKPDSEAEDKLLKIPKNRWNWRAFTFYIDAINSRDSSQKVEEQALLAAEEYMRYLPQEERAYMAKYETLSSYGRHEEAQRVLQEAEENLGMTAQCSLSLCKIYKMEGLFDEAIKSATKAIISTAEVQPSTSIASPLAERGFARDAMILRDIMNGIRSCEECEKDINLAIKDYELAKKIGYWDNSIINKRIAILKSIINGDSESAPSDSSSKSDSFFKFLELLGNDRDKLGGFLSSIEELSPNTSDDQEEN